MLDPSTYYTIDSHRHKCLPKPSILLMLDIMKRHTGYTIVEILIIISVLAILGAIALVGWGGVVTSSNDKARATDIREWVSAFELYRSRYTIWPVMPTANGAAGTVSQCLGTFTSTSGKCGQHTSSTAGQFLAASASSSMLSRVTKTGSTPVNESAPIKNGSRSVVGPYVRVSQSTTAGVVTVTAHFVGFFQGNCPDGYTLDSGNTPSSTMLTNMGSGAKACALQKTFSYSPS